MNAVAVLLAGTAVVASIGVHPAKTQRVVHSDVDLPAPFDNPRVLVDYVDTVFFGTVVAKVGSQALDPHLPETQFRIRVTDVLKGSLGSEVVVNQLGGVRTDTDELVLIEGDPLLTVGKTYFFASRTHPNGSWQTVVNEYGDLPMPDARTQARLRAVFVNAVANPLHYVPPAPQ